MADDAPLDPGAPDPDPLDDDIVGRKFGVPWTRRRWTMFAILGWAVIEISFVIHFVHDPAELAQKVLLAQALTALVASLVLGYVGFAVQDDRSRRAAVVSWSARVSPRAMTATAPDAPAAASTAGRGGVDEPG